MKGFILKYSLLVFVFCASWLCAQQERSAVRLGNELYASGKYEEALRAYEEALIEKPSDVQTQYNIANTQFRLEQLEQAASGLQQVIASTEDKTLKQKAYHNLGNVHMQNQEVDKAVDAYKNALRLNPKDEETRKNLAMALMQKRQQEKQDQQNQDQNQEDKENQDKQQNEQQKDDKQKGQYKDQQKQEGNKGSEKEKNESGSKEKNNEGEKDESKAASEGENGEQEGQKQEAKISKRDAEQLMKALEKNEENLRRKLMMKRMREQKQSDAKRIEKDW